MLYGAPLAMCAHIQRGLELLCHSTKNALRFPARTPTTSSRSIIPSPHHLADEPTRSSANNERHEGTTCQLDKQHSMGLLVAKFLPEWDSCPGWGRFHVTEPSRATTRTCRARMRGPMARMRPPPKPLSLPAAPPFPPLAGLVV